MTSIPFENYLNVRAAFAPSWAPDGSRVAFLTNITGAPQLWSVAAGGGWPEQLTFHPDRVLGAWYAPLAGGPLPADRIVYARDRGGNENAQFFLIDADGAGERVLTDEPGTQHVFGGWSPDGRRIAFAANRRHRGRYDVHVMDVDTGDTQMVWQNDLPGRVVPAGFSPDGARLLVLFDHGGLNQDLYEVELAQRVAHLLTEHDGAVRFAEPTYAAGSTTSDSQAERAAKSAEQNAPAGGKAVYCLSDSEREFAGVVRLDLAGLRVDAIAQPEHEVEYVAESRDGRYLAWVVNLGGANQIMLRDMRAGTTRQAPGLPTGVISPAPDVSGLVFAPDGARIAFSFSTPRRSSDVWLWDLEADTVGPLTHSSHAGIPASALIEPELVHYPSFDGRQIPAWFYRRPTGTGAPAPVVVYVHGGPEGQTQPNFFPILQYLAARGYAVLAPNVRGSTGYGKTYVHLDDVEKRMDSVADLAHAVHWLRAQPDLDASRIAVYGGSYGGFMVLSALTTYPDLWAAGVELVGISNFVTFLENTSAYRRSHREAEYGSLDRDREFLTRISPIHHVDQIQVPLLVIHGANDPRVPLGETEQMVAALHARNVPTELLVYPDEGHGLVRLANKLDAYPRVADFLDRHLRQTTQKGPEGK